MNSYALTSTDLLCFSHLRWDFVYQRPQHLMSRFAAIQRVFFIEESIFDAMYARFDVTRREKNLWQVQPHLPADAAWNTEFILRRLLSELLEDYRIKEYMSWYYTPMAIGFTQQLHPLVTVYDCMDELSAFRGAPPELLARESELLKHADLVFTGGQSLYQAKAKRHPNVHAFPSSVDRAHFGQARYCEEPEDQAHLPHPRLGFFGVIDERMDLDLIAAVADARPDWQLVIVGPVVKIDPSSLPQRTNLHYPGGRSYQELPHYLAGWDVALLPFARNEATRFISPTKTPEYLAGGKPVVSTSIRDVVQPYGEMGLVQIADTVPDFVAAAERALQQQANDKTWLARVDEFLADMSWDATWERMAVLIERELQARQKLTHVPHVQVPLQGYWNPAE